MRTLNMDYNQMSAYHRLLSGKRYSNQKKLNQMGTKLFTVKAELAIQPWNFFRVLP